MQHKFSSKTIVGLTGQSGAGKSTVSRIFKRHGFFVINADEVAREITSKPETAKMLSEHFGNSILNPDGTLNRKSLASIVFSNKSQLNLLNSLLFPVIIQNISYLIRSSKKHHILLDAPQLFESGLDKICNHIISVVAPHNIIVKRIMARDGMSEEDAEKRLSSQLSEEFFKENSDYVVYTDGTIGETEERVREIIGFVCAKHDEFEL